MVMSKIRTELGRWLFELPVLSSVSNFRVQSALLTQAPARCGLIAGANYLVVSSLPVIHSIMCTIAGTRYALANPSSSTPIHTNNSRSAMHPARNSSPAEDSAWPKIPNPGHRSACVLLLRQRPLAPLVVDVGCTIPEGCASPIGPLPMDLLVAG